MPELLNALNAQLDVHAHDVQLVDLAIEQEWTGAQVKRAVADFRENFEAHNIQKGDVVLLALGNTAWLTIIEQSLWEIGAIAHPISETTGVAEIIGEFEDYQYAAALVSDDIAERLTKQTVLLPEAFKTYLYKGHFYRFDGEPKRFIADNVEEQLALILNTSGTTGKPKRVGISFKKILLATRAVTWSQNITAEDHSLIVMPLFHINAQIVSTVTTRINGGQLIVAPKFSASHFWEIVAKYQITWLSVVPTIINILLQNEKSRQQFTALRDQIHLQYVRSASFSLPAPLLADFEQTFGVRVQEGYGMTESTTVVSINPLDNAKIGSVGPVVDTDIAIYGDNGVTYDSHVKGEIVLRGPRVLEAYMDPKDGILVDGYFRTGDIGYFDEDGYLYVIGRVKEIINYGGEKVAPAKVEALISQIDGVVETAVVGLPDDMYGERVTAVLHSATENIVEVNAIIEKIQDHMANELAKYERPTAYYVTGDFSRNPTGKVLRADLIERIWGRHQNGTN